MKHIFILLIAFTAIQHTTFSQQKLATRSKKAIKLFHQAQESYKNYQLDDCLNYLNQAIDKDSKFIEAYFLKADVYNQQSDFENEARCFKKTIDINPNYFTYQYYNLAQSYWKAGKYQLAKDNFVIFLTSKKGKPHVIDKAKYYIKRCDFALELVNHPVDFKPKALSKTINNAKDQYWPSLSIDGKTMVYTELQIDSTQKTAFGTFVHQEDFYISHLQTGGWSQGKPIGKPINTSGNEGAQQLSADGETLVFTGCNRYDSFGQCDIYFSYKTPNGWSKPVNAGPEINTRYSEKQPSLSPDGRRLFFASNRPESLGGMDLFVSYKNRAGQWQSAKNLGEIINTTGDELSPFMHSDNQTLYFSSTGHWGLGQNDLFITRQQDSIGWTKPENLGYPINTNMDEIGLVVDHTGVKAYYSSNKNNNSRDIYQFDLPEKSRPNPVAYVAGKIYNQDNFTPLAANLELLNPETVDTIMWVTADSTTGEYLMCLPTGFNYVLNAEFPGYLFWSDQFFLAETNYSADPFTLDIPLKPIKAGESMVLKNIFFESNAYKLLPQSKAELQKTIVFLNRNPMLKAEISGHTDNNGTSEYNQILSERRAKAVYDYISKQVSDKQRLSYTGYGETKPIASNKTEAGKANNRRTELKILE